MPLRAPSWSGLASAVSWKARRTKEWDEKLNCESGEGRKVEGWRMVQNGIAVEGIEAGRLSGTKKGQNAFCMGNEITIGLSRLLASLNK